MSTLCLLMFHSLLALFFQLHAGVQAVSVAEPTPTCACSSTPLGKLLKVLHWGEHERDKALGLLLSTLLKPYHFIGLGRENTGDAWCFDLNSLGQNSHTFYTPSETSFRLVPFELYRCVFRTSCGDLVHARFYPEPDARFVCIICRV